ncbi:MAG TPA: transcription antitermination factor NusB [Bacteroidales bacterium]|nr:transcription antitermination factor NusB [Bacteroidales bacterium]HQI69654.1 transcription antitermination factor NusB [Bacteroidales bacterium]
MQALYAFFQSDNDRVDVAVKNLQKNIFGIYNLYIYQMSFLIEIVDFARETIEIKKNKYFPTKEEANPNTRFVNNSIILKIENSPDYKRKYEELNINWADQEVLIRKAYQQITEADFFQAYMNHPKDTADNDFRVLEQIVDNFIAENEALQQYFEDMNVFWADDFDVACFMLIKTLKYLKNSNEKNPFLPTLFGNQQGDDEKEEVKFFTDLFSKTVIHRDKFDDLIEARVDNWEIDRIALMDSLLIKMALAEFTEFPTIPTKVTINEYIEISKMYSTPKSKVFINGLLDKLLFELTEKKKIKKTGRGLIG